MEAIGGGHDGVRAAPDAIGKAVRIDDAVGRYVQFLKHAFPKELTLDGVQGRRRLRQRRRLPASRRRCSGAGRRRRRAERLARRPEHQLRLRRAAPRDDGRGGAARRARALGIALDGDADRVILARRERATSSTAIRSWRSWARACSPAGELPGQTVVATVMSNLGLERALAARKAASWCAPRSAIATSSRRCASSGFKLGGEQSGHLIFLDHATTGDGIVAALRVLAVMVRGGQAAVGAGADDDPLSAGAAQLRGRAQAPVRGDADGAEADRARSRASWAPTAACWSATRAPKRRRA